VPITFDRFVVNAKWGLADTLANGGKEGRRRHARGFVYIRDSYLHRNMTKSVNDCLKGTRRSGSANEKGYAMDLRRRDTLLEIIQVVEAAISNDVAVVKYDNRYAIR